MNMKLIPLVLVGATILTACGSEESTTTTSVSKEDAVASVNGQYISKAALATLEKEIAQRGQGQSFPKEKLIEELVQKELLVQDASQKQLDKTAEYTDRLEMIKGSLLSQAAIQNYLKSNPITDADLKAEYETSIAASGSEYKARHILVKTEEEAKQIIELLNSGSDFVELAKTKSTGPSGPQGGDLGWFAAAQMVAPFSEAVIALEDNKFTTEAVNTQFGWHVILREGSRSQTPPPFESVKEQIRPMLQRKKMQDFLESLRTNAKVEIFLEKEQAAKVEADVAIEAKEEEKAATTEQTTEAVVDVVEVVVEKTAKQGTEAVETAKEELKSTTKEVADAVTKEATTAVDAVSDSATKAIDSVVK